jgi:hypothetical protein
MMKKLNGLISILLISMFAAGCSTMTLARYSVSVDANRALEAIPDTKVHLASLSPPPTQDVNCRLMGPIKASDGMTITEFIQDAFNDEFKFADVYDVSGIRLDGEVTQIEFSSIDGLTNGHWNLGLTLRSSNGKQMSTHVNYQFKSGFDGITACNQTADALGAAVQDLVVKTVTDAGFELLLK